MRRCFVSLAVISAVLSLTQQLRSQELDENIVNSAVLISRFTGGQTKELGTGFLCIRSVPAEDPTKHSFEVLLITNKHVLPLEKSQFHQISIRIAVRENGITQVKELAVDVIAANGEFNQYVAMHPNPRVDTPFSIRFFLPVPYCYFARSADTCRALTLTEKVLDKP
jgi:hypothetical protein